MKRKVVLFLILPLLIIIAFIGDLAWGSIHMSFGDVIDALQRLSQSGEELSSTDYIVLNFRLPKAITALIAGAGIATAGLCLQSLFQNPLADTSILGINSGAGVGVALYTMSHVLFPAHSTAPAMYNVWAIALSACIGAFVVLMIILGFVSYLKDIVSVLIIGVMVGFLASSIITVLQFFSEEEALRSYLLWSFGSISGTTWGQLRLVIPVVSFALLLTLTLPKYLNALTLGENYARSVGVNVQKVRVVLIIITSIITGTITAFVGPIAFLGLAVPHFCRIIFRTADHKVLIVANMLCGSLLLLCCDMLTQMPNGAALPVNAITSMIGAPIVVLGIIKSSKKRSIFK